MLSSIYDLVQIQSCRVRVATIRHDHKIMMSRKKVHVIPQTGYENQFYLRSYQGPVQVGQPKNKGRKFHM